MDADRGFRAERPTFRRENYVLGQTRHRHVQSGTDQELGGQAHSSHPTAFTASHESLWREDAIYEVIVILGHNDNPPVPGAGSAIFLHVARPDYRPTQGCVAVDLDALLAVLRSCTRESALLET